MTDIINEVQNRNRPMPELFTRQDIRNTGGWDVGNARAVRGEPYITVAGRIMRVPMDDSELARAIRGHEQIHVKVSPQDLTPFITDVTGEGAIRAAEEARVNLIASMLGFPMKALVTGSEKFDGELLAEHDQWDEAVYAVAASVHTGSLNPLIVGIRRVSPEWADALRDIAKEIVKFQKNQIKIIKRNMFGANRTSDTDALRRYGSTMLMDHTGLISGMNYTIELAMLLESIAAMPAPEPAPEDEAASDEDSGDQGDDNGTDDAEGDEESQQGEGGSKPADKLGQEENPDDLQEKKDKTFDRKAIQKKAKDTLNTRIGTRGIGNWLDINVKRMPMTLTVPGAIGRKRVASNMGRNPRRMHRLLTDPDKRIFDKYVKSVGGVVLIDCSGSMSLSKEDVKEMMLAAPGCTVIGYSATWQTGVPNTFILGEKGKICNELPKFWGGNGNDLPAIQFAVSKRTNSKTPVIWITDGMVYRPGGGGEYDERECAEYARKHRVHMEYSPEGAIKYLNELKRGAAYKPQILSRWKDHLKKVA